jgi:hypothetical protein
MTSRSATTNDRTRYSAMRHAACAISGYLRVALAKHLQKLKGAVTLTCRIRNCVLISLWGLSIQFFRSDLLLTFG